MTTTLKAFLEHGWDVHVVVDDDHPSGGHDGLTVTTCPSRHQLRSEYRWCDVVFTQLVSRNRAMRYAAYTDRPVVHFLRMGGLDHRTALGIPALVVFNAEWLRASTVWPGATTVLHPPIDCTTYATTSGTAITLVNLSDRKGAPVLFELARRMPETEFLGVRGAWGEQLPPPAGLANLEVVGPVEDMRSVYRRTRVLLMPSEQEPYGRVGIEAGCSGIPTIATPLPGIQEALGNAALFAERRDLDAWEAQLRTLEEPQCYEERSRVARAHALAVTSNPELSAFIDLVAEIVRAHDGRRAR